MTDKFKIEIHADDADRIRDWLANRGGVAIWPSIDLRNPGGKIFTPGDKTSPPGWQYAKTPSEIVTDAGEIGVYTEKLYKAIPVALRRGSNGLTLKLTDGAQRKVDRLMEKCRDLHGNAHFKRGVLDDVPASIGVFYIDGGIHALG